MRGRLVRSLRFTANGGSMCFAIVGEHVGFSASVISIRLAAIDERVSFLATH